MSIIAAFILFSGCLCVVMSIIVAFILFLDRLFVCCDVNHCSLHFISRLFVCYGVNHCSLHFISRLFGCCDVNHCSLHFISRLLVCCGVNHCSLHFISRLLCVVASFPFVFMRCYGIDCSSSENLRFLYYAFYIAIFQFGWAATQVAHLALIPQLTQNDSERVELNAFR